jgi:hydantoinase/carbamoylase family amidase
VSVASPSAARIESAIGELASPPYTGEGPGITRHAYTDAYRNTLEWFERAFRELGFDVWQDPVGTLVASNRAPGEACFGIGSHCDSVRGGGAFDGTMGVVCALEVCRLASERGLDIGLRVISFLEEEGSGFGQLLLGSRIVAQDVSEDELRSYLDEDGVSFVEAARRAGHEPERHREAGAVLDGLHGWIEMHIEQGRVLESERLRLGIVDAIAGYIHADLVISGRRDHAGATPMDMRSDAGITAAELVIELEQLARESSPDTVGTVGELSLEPGAINVIPATARLSLDTRSVSGDHVRVAERITESARERAARRGQTVHYSERQRVAPTVLDAEVAAALEEAARRAGVPARRMHSAAAHDTMMVARRVPAAMVFVPCVDGVSHSPEEQADAEDGAIAAAVILEAIQQLMPQ